jgi:LPXTG-motif cell wall-anchored protein
MLSTRALAVSATAVAALGLTAPQAVAWDSSSNIVAMPSVIARGGQLTVTVDGCPKGGTMESKAFPQAKLSPIKVGSETSKGTATVNRSATPGAYDITVHCDDKPGLTKAAAFTVIGGVRGGLGGGSSSGATPTDMAIGGTLVGLALAGGGVFWLRRRSESKI